jgi:hypothetical protein
MKISQKASNMPPSTTTLVPEQENQARIKTMLRKGGLQVFYHAANGQI